MFSIKGRPVCQELIGAGILWGWVEIAAYLRVPTTSVMRWHRFRPLPVTRIGRRYCAAASALDRWITSRMVDENPIPAADRAVSGRMIPWPDLNGAPCYVPVSRRGLTAPRGLGHGDQPARTGLPISGRCRSCDGDI